jgi:hypothetical protein
VPECSHLQSLTCSSAAKCVTDDWAEDDPACAQNADGWPRILSRLKTLLETGKTFRPH